MRTTRVSKCMHEKVPRKCVNMHNNLSQAQPSQPQTDDEKGQARSHLFEGGNREGRRGMYVKLRPLRLFQRQLQHVCQHIAYAMRKRMSTALHRRFEWSCWMRLRRLARKQVGHITCEQVGTRHMRAGWDTSHASRLGHVTCEQVGTRHMRAFVGDVGTTSMQGCKTFHVQHVTYKILVFLSPSAYTCD